MAFIPGFARGLIFMYFTSTVTVTELFLLNATPSVKLRLLEKGVY